MPRKIEFPVRVVVELLFVFTVALHFVAMKLHSSICYDEVLRIQRGTKSVFMVEATFPCDLWNQHTLSKRQLPLFMTTHSWAAVYQWVGAVAVASLCSE